MSSDGDSRRFSAIPQLQLTRTAQAHAQCGLGLYRCYKSVTLRVSAGLSGSEHARFRRENVLRVRASGPRNVRARVTLPLNPS